MITDSKGITIAASIGNTVYADIRHRQRDRSTVTAVYFDPQTQGYIRVPFKRATVDAKGHQIRAFNNWTTRTTQGNRLSYVKSRLLARKLQRESGYTQEQFAKLVAVFGLPQPAYPLNGLCRAVRLLHKRNNGSLKSGSVLSDIADVLHNWIVDDSATDDLPLTAEQACIAGLD